MISKDVLVTFGIVVACIGAALLLAAVPVWTFGVPLLDVGPKVMRFVVHTWPGWGILWLGIGLFNIGVERRGGADVPGAKDHPVAQTGTVLGFTGMAAVAIGVLLAMYGNLNGLSRRWEPAWLSPVPRPAEPSGLRSQAQREVDQIPAYRRWDRRDRIRLGRLILGLAVLTIGAVWLVMTGDTRDQVAGWLWLGFIGVCGLIGLAAVVAAIRASPSPDPRRRQGLR